MGKMVSANGTPQDKPRNKRDVGDRGRVEWRGYISPTLTTSEKATYKKWRADTGACEQALKSALDTGYKISVDFQTRERAYRAGLYCQAVGSENAGYCLTAFASDWWEAINRVVFIHSQVLGGSWTKVISPSGWKDDWVD